MRRLFYIIFVIFCQTIIAADVNKRTVSAVEYINNGYIQYGCEELKKAAAMNDIAAQFYVAVCYEKGIGMASRDRGTAACSRACGLPPDNGGNHFHRIRTARPEPGALGRSLCTQRI